MVSPDAARRPRWFVNRSGVVAGMVSPYASFGVLAAVAAGLLFVVVYDAALAASRSRDGPDDADATAPGRS